MQNLLWNYNPLSLAYQGLVSVGQYLSVSQYLSSNDYSNIIKKPNRDNISKYSLIIFDVDGVLRIDSKVIPLADITFNKIKEMEIPICIITNSSRKSPKLIKQELTDMGYEIDSQIDLISASSLVVLEICNILKNNTIPINKQSKNKKNSLPHIFNIGIIGEANLLFYITRKITKKYTNCCFYWIKDNMAFRNISHNIDYFIIGSMVIDNDIQLYIDRAAQWFNCNTNASIIISSPDRFSDEKIKEMDYYQSTPLLDIIKTKGVKEYGRFEIPSDQKILGKPHCSDYIDKICERYNIDISSIKENERLPILMVGDNLDTDIAFAKKINCDSCLVLSGVTKLTDIQEDNSLINNIDYVIPDISYLCM